MRSYRLINKTVFIGLFIGLIFGSSAWGLTAQEIAQRSFPSVVLLIMEDANAQPISLGSGFFVRDNIVATNFHVIEESIGGYAKIVAQKTKYKISGTVGIDKNVDLVLLSVDRAKALPLFLGNSAQVQIGDEIYAVGNPLGLEGTFSKGIISGIRKIGAETIFQLTAPISPGSSGGPVLNSRGEVIGIAVATFSGGQNLNFAIPVNNLNLLLSKITPVKSLSTKLTSKKKTAFSSLGKPSIEGVIARKFRWGFEGDFSFSLYNKLRRPITDIGFLVIFYDDEGIPIDVETEHWGIKNYKPEDYPCDGSREIKEAFVDKYVRETGRNRKAAYSLLKMLCESPILPLTHAHVLEQSIPPRQAKLISRSTSNQTRSLTQKVEIRILRYQFVRQE